MTPFEVALLILLVVIIIELVVFGFMFAGNFSRVRSRLRNIDESTRELLIESYGRNRS